MIDFIIFPGLYNLPCVKGAIFGSDALEWAGKLASSENPRLDGSYPSANVCANANANSYPTT